MGTWSTQSSRSQCICSKRGKNAAQRNVFSLVRPYWDKLNQMNQIAFACARCEGSKAPSVCCVPLNVSRSASPCHFPRRQTTPRTLLPVQALRLDLGAIQVWEKPSVELWPVQRPGGQRIASTWTSWVCETNMDRRNPNYKGVSFRKGMFWHFLLVSPKLGGVFPAAFGLGPGVVHHEPWHNANHIMISFINNTFWCCVYIV